MQPVGDETLTKQQSSPADNEDGPATVTRQPRPFVQAPRDAREAREEDLVTPVGQKKKSVLPPPLPPPQKNATANANASGIANGAIISNAALQAASPVTAASRPSIPRPSTPPKRKSVPPPLPPLSQDQEPPLAVGPSLLDTEPRGSKVALARPPTESSAAISTPLAMVVTDVPPPESGATRIAPLAMPIATPASIPPVALPTTPPPSQASPPPGHPVAKLLPLTPQRLAVVGSLFLLVAVLTFALVRRQQAAAPELAAAPTFPAAVDLPPPVQPPPSLVPVVLAPPAPIPPPPPTGAGAAAAPPPSAKAAPRLKMHHTRAKSAIPISRE